ncbi:MAG TPA: hypothetical protein VJT83_05685, partial [Chitinophagaceae bacterium]|nr:hypothetical protein [Chitinophagaceae bacterium]
MKQIGLFLSAVLLPFLLNAQAKFYTVVDQAKVGRHQLVQVQFVVENAKTVDKFNAPVFTNFNVLQG